MFRSSALLVDLDDQLLVGSEVQVAVATDQMAGASGQLGNGAVGITGTGTRLIGIMRERGPERGLCLSLSKGSGSGHLRLPNVSSAMVRAKSEAMIT